MIDLEVVRDAGHAPARASRSSRTRLRHGDRRIRRNIVGVDPLVRRSSTTRRSSPARPASSRTRFTTTLFRADPPPPGHDGLPGDYHISAGSPATCEARVSGRLPALVPDIDRPGSASSTLRIEPIGADEVPVAAADGRARALAGAGRRRRETVSDEVLLAKVEPARLPQDRRARRRRPGRAAARCAAAAQGGQLRQPRARLRTSRRPSSGASRRATASSRCPGARIR